MSKVVCIIPARMASTRFPGKPIKKILGIPMIEHVYRRIKTAKFVNEVYIATCDEEIKNTAENFGAPVVMTSDQHVRGTDRVAEAATKVDADIVINVQGDEPLVDPSSINEAISLMNDDASIKCVNLVSIIKDWNVFIDPHVVKTVLDQQGKVLYFSRQPIPNNKIEIFEQGIKQIGIYLFRKQFLLDFTSWNESPLEVKEGVDMMRILEYGHSIHSYEANDMISVDTPQDLVAMEEIMANDFLYKQLFLSV